MRVLRTLIVVLGVGAPVLFFVWRGGRENPDAVPASGGQTKDSAQATLASVPGQGSRKAVGAGKGQFEPLGSDLPILSQDDLVALLRKIAEAESERTKAPLDPEKAAALEDVLRPILYVEENAYAVLALLPLLRPEGIQSTTPTDMLPEEYGGLIAIAWGIIAYNAPLGEGELDAAGVFVDGQAYLMATLELLSQVVDPVRAYLADMLANRVHIEGRLVLDARYLQEVLRLRAQFQGASKLQAVYSALLANMGGQLTPAERDAIFALFLDESDDPRMISIALENLLQGEAPELAVSIAAGLYDESEELRDTIRDKIARRAPPAEAAAFLADRYGNGNADVKNLSMREGGPEAIEMRYHELLADDDNPKGRQKLTAGIEAPDSLFAISQTDPSSLVREQALLSLSAAHGGKGSQRLLSALRAGTADPDDPALGVGSFAAAMAACNVVRFSDDAALRDEASTFLLDLARNDRYSTSERRRTVERLYKGAVSEEVYAAILAELAD